MCFDRMHTTRFNDLTIDYCISTSWCLQVITEYLNNLAVISHSIEKYWCLKKNDESQRIVLNEIWNTCVCSWLVAMGESTKMVMYINWNANKAFMWEKLKGLSFWTFSVVAKLFIETQDDFTTCTLWGNKKRDVIILIHEHISLPLMFTMHCSIFQYTLHIEKLFSFQ